MKKIYIFLFLVFCVKGLSQNGEKFILVKDVDTNKPIQDASVFILKSKQNFISNSEGIVSFVLKGNSNIKIEHTDYSEIIIRSTSLKETENVVYLKSKTNKLDEIILTKQHPQKILKNLIENSVKKLTVPGRLKVYSREFFKLNGNYSYYNDGLLNFQLYDNSKNFDVKILVEQNRSYGLIDKDISPYLLGYNLENLIENYYKFKYLEPLLNSKAKADYEFIIKGYTDNEDYYVIEVNPIEISKGLKDDYKIIYDNKKKIIIEVSSSVSPKTVANNTENSLFNSKAIYKSLFKTTYRIDGENYYLINSREEIGFEQIVNKQSTEIEVRNYFVVSNFSKQNYTHNDNQVFKDKALFNKKNVILTDYWTNSGLTPTDEELEIINQIETNQ